MKKGKPELLAWRLRRAEESFQMIEISVNQEYWDVERELDVNTHRGLKLIFAQEFTTEMLDKK
jgi:hypothetical protein